MQMKIAGTIYTTVYSVIVVIFGSLYKILAVRQTEDENHRYWKQYTDALSSRLFQFNVLNFYFPMLWVAFDARNKRNYHDLFNLMLVQMAVKQVSANVVEYVQPIIMAKRKLDELAEDFRPVINKYKEVGEPEGDEPPAQKEGLSQSKVDLLDVDKKRENQDGADKGQKTVQRF